jgi:hypothetical protein
MHWAAGKAAGGVRLEMTSAAGRSVDGMETATAEAATAMKATGVKAAAGMKAAAASMEAAAGMKAAAAGMKAAPAAMEAATAGMKAAPATMEAATAMEASTSSSAASGCLRQICGGHCYGGTREDGGKRHRDIDVASSSRHVFPPPCFSGGLYRRSTRASEQQLNSTLASAGETRTHRGVNFGPTGRRRVIGEGVSLCGREQHRAERAART